jgi:hypothetical protein
VQSHSSTVSYDVDGHLSGLLSHSGAGADGTWNTGDDVVDTRYLYRYAAAGLQVWEILYSGPGADGVWGTADDTVLTSSRVDLPTPYDIHHLSKITYFDAPGPNRTWGDDDDVIHGVRVYDCGVEFSFTDYKSPGPDATWGTSDDVVSGQGATRGSSGACGFDVCAVTVL